MKLVYIVAPFILLMAACSQNTLANKSTDNTKTLYIDSVLVDCVGIIPMKCMKVKESPDADWGNFYDHIEGFSYEPGYKYQVKVKTTDIQNPPADGSSIHYQLISVINMAQDTIK